MSPSLLRVSQQQFINFIEGKAYRFRREAKRTLEFSRPNSLLPIFVPKRNQLPVAWVKATLGYAECFTREEIEQFLKDSSA